MATNLYEILPPTRQSDVETMACPQGYIQIVVNKRNLPTSIPSERGKQIHRVMSEYAEHCAHKRIAADWVYFNKLAESVGHEDAGPVLDGVRDLYQVDWQRFYASEVPLALTEDFQPTRQVYDVERKAISRVLDKPIPGVVYSEEPAAHIGTLDVIYLTEDGTRAKIPDFKSHFYIFDADTYQSHAYPLFLFKHFPKLERITFELCFVRYKNCFRGVTFTRQDIPELQAKLRRARIMQAEYRECPDDAPALPCVTCTYCPLMRDLSCPVGDYNEHMVLSPQERLRKKEFFKRAAKSNNEPLLQWAKVRGKVEISDGNGNKTIYGEHEVPETRIPLDKTLLQVLEEHRQATGEDLLDGRLNVSQSKVKSLLDTKKRTELRKVFEDTIFETGTKPKYATRTLDGGLETDFNPYSKEEDQ